MTEFRKTKMHIAKQWLKDLFEEALKVMTTTIPWALIISAMFLYVLAPLFIDINNSDFKFKLIVSLALSIKIGLSLYDMFKR